MLVQLRAARRRPAPASAAAQHPPWPGGAARNCRGAGRRAWAGAPAARPQTAAQRAGAARPTARAAALSPGTRAQRQQAPACVQLRPGRRRPRPLRAGCPSNRPASAHTPLARERFAGGGAAMSGHVRDARQVRWSKVCRMRIAAWAQRRMDAHACTHERRFRCCQSRAAPATHAQSHSAPFRSDQHPKAQRTELSSANDPPRGQGTR